MIYPFVPNQQFPQAAQKLRFVWWWLWWWWSFSGPSASAQSDTSGGVCSEALASFPAFRVRLRELSFFKHQSRSWTVWLKPETEVESHCLIYLLSSCGLNGAGCVCVCVTHQPEGALVRLQGELERVFPHCNDQSQIGEHGFTPHLSVANDFRKAVRHPSLSFVLFRFRSFFPSPASLILSTLYL